MVKFDKEEFLKVFKKSLGNVTVACNNFGCERQTFYNWYNEDADFRAKADAVKEIRKDFIESALDKRIQEGDTTAIIFAAKTQCKDRGYVEKQELKVETEQPLFGFIDEDER
jgi:hypothetical protein